VDEDELEVIISKVVSIFLLRLSSRNSRIEKAQLVSQSQIYIYFNDKTGLATLKTNRS